VKRKIRKHEETGNRNFIHTKHENKKRPMRMSPTAQAVRDKRHWGWRQQEGRAQEKCDKRRGRS
jgi:hypothetical protein